MTNSKRSGFLDKLLSRENAEAVSETVEEAQAALDEAKVARKAEGDTPAPAGGPSDATKAVVGALLRAFTDAGITDAVLAAENGPKTPDDFAAFLLNAVGSVIDKEEAAEGAPAGEDTAMAMKALEDNQAQIAEYIASTVKDNGTIAQSMLDIVGVMKDLGPTVSGLDARMKAIEDKLGDTPRQASKAAETVIENEGLARTMKEAIEGKPMFLGVETKEPIGSRKNGVK